MNPIPRRTKRQPNIIGIFINFLFEKYKFVGGCVLAIGLLMGFTEQFKSIFEAIGSGMELLYSVIQVPGILIIVGFIMLVVIPHFNKE